MRWWQPLRFSPQLGSGFLPAIPFLLYFHFQPKPPSPLLPWLRFSSAHSLSSFPYSAAPLLFLVFLCSAAPPNSQIPSSCFSRFFPLLSDETPSVFFVRLISAFSVGSLNPSRHWSLLFLSAILPFSSPTSSFIF